MTFNQLVADGPVWEGEWCGVILSVSARVKGNSYSILPPHKITIQWNITTAEV